MIEKDDHKKSRRAFLSQSAKFAAMLPVIGSGAFNYNTSTLAKSQVQLSNKPLKILILGGTSFLGPHQIAYALERGHSISTFTRGKTKPTIHQEKFKKVETLVGDREDNLEALKNRKWDIVIDNSGRRVKWTKDTASLLKNAAEHYIYVSSVSVYYPYLGTDFNEDRKLVLSLPDKEMSEDDKMTYDYGIMKANSELAAINEFGKDRTTVVRPHFIVGPADATDRFTYWPVRLEKGGEVLVPGKAGDKVQYIDVRDLAQWMIHICEQKITGTFNATGPASPMNMQAFVYGAHAAFSSPISYVHIDDHQFLQENNVPFLCPWVAPVGDYVGMSIADNSNAIANGLTFTPLAKTVQDINSWWYSDGVPESKRKNMVEGENAFMKREAEVIKKWREKKSK